MVNKTKQHRTIEKRETSHFSRRRERKRPKLCHSSTVGTNIRCVTELRSTNSCPCVVVAGLASNLVTKHVEKKMGHNTVVWAPKPLQLVSELREPPRDIRSRCKGKGTDSLPQWFDLRHASLMKDSIYLLNKLRRQRLIALPTRILYDFNKEEYSAQSNQESVG